MTHYHVTITGDFDAANEAEALNEFKDWIIMSGTMDQGCVIVSDDDPANPDTIWHTLTLTAKQAWIEAMYPTPTVEQDPPL